MFKVGDLVCHKVFGVGRVLSIRNENIACIDFGGFTRDVIFTYLELKC